MPEVVQTSLMDCGPASLKAALDGFGIAINYDRLRERCQTDVDGTSVDALAALATQAGIRATQILAPRDSLLLPEADLLPAIAVTATASGTLHFVVVWRVVGPLVQVMDPQRGRRWMHKNTLLASLANVPVPVRAATWRRWAGTEDALGPLRAKMRRIGIRPRTRDALVSYADADPAWGRFAALDAAVRMAGTLVRGGAIRGGPEAAALTSALVERAIAPAGDGYAIPPGFWWVQQGRSPGELRARGTVLVHFEPAEGGGRSPARKQSAADLPGWVPTPANGAAPGCTAYRSDHDADATGRASIPTATVIPANIAAALKAPTIRPLALLWRLARADAQGTVAAAIAAAVAGAVVTTADAFLLRSLFGVAGYLSLPYQRGIGLAVLLGFVVLGFCLEYLLAASVNRLGLGLEVRLRVAFLEKLPRLADRYLRSRPISDMAARGHAMHLLRDAPSLGARVVRSLASLAVTTAGIAWLSPASAPMAGAGALIALLAPYLLRRPLLESALKMRTQAGALQRFYLDVLIGCIPVRVHGAERAVRREHEALLLEWARSGHAMRRQAAVAAAVQTLVSTALAVLIVARFVALGGDMASILLLVFWVLRLPATGQELTQALTSWPNLRNVALRVFSPIGADESEAPGTTTPACVPPRARAGVHVSMSGVTVRATGHTLLRGVTLDIPPGNHVAIVGASGAGKSTLVSLLLGWLSPAEGRVFVDGEPLDAARLVRLRLETAWVDPAVQLWNRTLLENLVYGAGAGALDRLPDAIDRAGLTGVLEAVPEGMQAELGEGGARVSGGQGQRIRLGRALVREHPRLAILDEPFRGLERAERQALMKRARLHFRDSTLLFVSHDVSDTADFDRVLVIHDGAIVEDASPSVLLSRPSSRYRALAAMDQRMRDELGTRSAWRRMRMDRGVLREIHRGAAL